MKLLKIIDIVKSLGSDNLESVGGEYVGGVYLQQIPDEIGPFVFDLLNEGVKLEYILEIGSAAGGNIFLLNRFFGVRKSVLIDNNRHLNSPMRYKILKDIKYSEFLGDSHSDEALNFIENQRLEYDLIFIDGDHRYKGVKLDFNMYHKFCKKGGLIALHDTFRVPGVKKFFEELKKMPGVTFIKEYISKEHNRPCGIGLFRRED
jgi:predicted O-methyltransferase YrrM